MTDSEIHDEKYRLWWLICTSERIAEFLHHALSVLSRETDPGDEKRISRLLEVVDERAGLLTHLCAEIQKER